MSSQYPQRHASKLITRSIVSSVTIEVIERVGSDVSVPEAIAAADRKMRDKVVYHIHRLPQAQAQTQLGAVSSTLIRAYQPPLFTLGGILGGSYLVAEAVNVNIGNAVRASSASRKAIASPSAPTSPSRTNNTANTDADAETTVPVAVVVAAKDANEPVLTNSLQGVDPEVLAYMEKNELYFFSPSEKRRRVLLRVLSVGAVCAVLSLSVSVGVVLLRRTTLLSSLSSRELNG
jgi:hypothetical protein